MSNVIQGKFTSGARPWPADSWPTAEQFADWYVTQPREERVQMARWIVLQGQEAERCHRMDHEARIAQQDVALRFLYQQAATQAASTDAEAAS